MFKGHRVNQMVSSFFPELISPLVLAIYISYGNKTDLASAFTIMSLLDMIKGPIQHLAWLSNNASEFRTHMDKVQFFLDMPEVPQECLVAPSQETEWAIKIDNKSFSWGLKFEDEEAKKEKEESGDKKVEQRNAKCIDDVVSLKNIDFKVKKGEFVCIIGDVGAGKSSLLSALSGDMLQATNDFVKKFTETDFAENENLKNMQNQLINDSRNSVSAPVMMNGSIALVEQSPWIQNNTIRGNIEQNFGMDKKKYVDTIKECQLSNDFQILTAGDLTEIGEKGINLSGGQKARVSLARAVYADKDIYLMDDPISALDASVRQKIIENVIFGRLQNKTRILVTHAIDFLHLADKLFIMEKGSIIAQGSYQDLKKSQNPHLVSLEGINKLNNDNITQNKQENGEDSSSTVTSSAKVSEASEVSDEEVEVEVKDVEQQFNELGRITKENDGKIIKDENLEDIVIKDDIFSNLIKISNGFWLVFFGLLTIPVAQFIDI
jgi:ATP-binding cassette subfamily C (CFTR/MRP) protein 10